ncbi:hypothetical protein B0T14DRAFT_82155 [Immersiella caudata]|uniref:Uncharacterized protein n=1 Tax=Immersiella caudata TaxID=314043 RepID=A0AA39XGW2_9PEZI|nr:hypothetical protein B0T14DRAFT_82155 [Immersiella caudata]
MSPRSGISGCAQEPTEVALRTHTGASPKMVPLGGCSKKWERKLTIYFRPSYENPAGHLGTWSSPAGLNDGAHTRMWEPRSPCFAGRLLAHWLGGPRGALRAFLDSSMSTKAARSHRSNAMRGRSPFPQRVARLNGWHGNQSRAPRVRPAALGARHLQSKAVIPFPSQPGKLINPRSMAGGAGGVMLPDASRCVQSSSPHGYGGNVVEQSEGKTLESETSPRTRDTDYHRGTMLFGMGESEASDNSHQDAWKWADGWVQNEPALARQYRATGTAHVRKLLARRSSPYVTPLVQDLLGIANNYRLTLTAARSAAPHKPVFTRCCVSSRGLLATWVLEGLCQSQAIGQG